MDHKTHNVIFLFGDSDAGQAEVPRRRVSGPSPRRLLALHKKEFKSKPLRERDRDLLSMEVRKELFTKQWSVLSDGEDAQPLTSNEGFYRFLKIF